MVAGANLATLGARGSVRVGLPHSVAARHALTRRAGWGGAGLHRFARLGRGLRAGRGLDRTRRHVRAVMRRRSSAPRRHTAFSRRGPHQRWGRAFGSGLLGRHDGHARRGKATRDLSILRRSLGEARRAGRKGRPGPRERRRPPDHGRRADLRFDRRLSIGGMEHRRARPDQAHPCRRTHSPVAPALCAGRPSALWPRQMVSGRAAAALGVRALLAARRQADLARRRARCAGDHHLLAACR
jgi:hypothetical protein